MNCRFIPVQFTDRNFLTKSAFMHEASRPTRHNTYVACLIRKADLLVLRQMKMQRIGFIGHINIKTEK